MKNIIAALETLRAPIQQGEYDLHRLVMDALDVHGISYEHEAKLAPRCRIDLLCGSAGGIGIEIKRGKLDRARLIAQLTRYAQCEQLTGLILVAEKSISLPRIVAGKPLHIICLNRLWGIAL